MQGKGKLPVVRETFTTPNKLLSSLAFLRAMTDQILSKTGPSQIKNRQKHATKLAEGVNSITDFPGEKDKAIRERAAANKLVT